MLNITPSVCVPEGESLEAVVNEILREVPREANSLSVHIRTSYSLWGVEGGKIQTNRGELPVYFVPDRPDAMFKLTVVVGYGLGAFESFVKTS